MANLAFKYPTADPSFLDMFETKWNVPLTWGLGFTKPKADVPGLRRKDSMAWSGAFNTHFLVDHTAGLGFVFVTQIDPFGDLPTNDIFDQYERAV